MQQQQCCESAMCGEGVGAELRSKLGEITAKEERMKNMEASLHEEQQRLNTSHHAHRMEALLAQEQARAKEEALRRAEKDLCEAQRRIDCEREELRRREMQLCQKLESADMRLENNFRKALALEKQRMNEDLELQLGQRGRKLEHDLEVQYNLESQRRIDAEVKKITDQIRHEAENDIKMIEAAKNREMEHELDKQSMKHQSELQELRAQMKDLLAVEEQKQTQLQMLLERERSCWEEERMRLSHEARVHFEVEKERLDREMGARADMERAKLEHVKRDMMELIARQNRAANDPILMERNAELQRKEGLIQELKVELAHQKEAYDDIKEKYKDEVRNLREKLTSKVGLISALKQFELSVRQTMFREAGVVPSAQDMIHALKTMPPKETQFIVTSAAVKLCPPEEEVFEFMRCLKMPQIKRIIKRLKLIFEPTELAPFYRNMNIRQQEKFMEFILDKMSFNSISCFLRKLDCVDIDYVVFCATNRYLLKSKKAIIGFIHSLSPECQNEYLAEL
ncbi:uncharacterized protein LOC142335948 isoform X2 [Convolutriloba macropyga]